MAELDPVAVDSSGKLPHPLFETTDTFQQLIDHLNDYGDSVDANLDWLDSAIGDRNFLSTGDNQSIVNSINEIDSDIYGVRVDSSGNTYRGGNFATETLSREKTILGAMNSVFRVFDPDSAGFHFDSSSFHIVVSGPGQSLSLVSDSDVNIVAAYDKRGGRVVLSADSSVQLRHLEQERVNINFNQKNGKDRNKLFSKGIWEVQATDSVIMKSDANYFSMNDVVDWHLVSGKIQSTLHGDLEQEIQGDYGITFDNTTEDNILNLSRSDRANSLSIVLSKDSDYIIKSETSLAIDAPEVTITTGTITQQADTIRLKDPTGLTYGAFTNEGGFLTIRGNQDSAFLNLVTEGNNLRSTQVNGMVELPTRPVPGAMSLEFDAIGTRKLHDILESINRKIPRVYDRDGNLLNTLS